MSDCSNHPRDVAGITDMKELAQIVGDLNYEALKDFFIELRNKFSADAEKDRDAGRKKIADALYQASGHTWHVYYHIDQAWEISKPFMKRKKR